MGSGTVELGFNSCSGMKRKIANDSPTMMFSEYTQLPVCAMAFCHVSVVCRKTIVCEDDPHLIAGFIDNNIKIFMHGMMFLPTSTFHEFSMGSRHHILFIDENVNPGIYHRTQKINKLVIDGGMCGIKHDFTRRRIKYRLPAYTPPPTDNPSSHTREDEEMF